MVKKIQLEKKNQAEIDAMIKKMENKQD